MTLDKDSSDKLFTVSVDEVGSTISAGQSPTIVAGSVRIVPIKACLRTRDKTLSSEEHRIDIFLGTFNTRFVDESGSTLKGVVCDKGVESVESLKENGSVGDSHV